MIDPKPLWNFDDPRESQSQFESLAKETEEINDKAILLTQVARALGLQGEFKSGFNLCFKHIFQTIKEYLKP